MGADEGVLGEHLADCAAEGAGALAVDDAQLGEASAERLVQPLLDGVVQYLPSPVDRVYYARDNDNEGAEVAMTSDPDAPLVMMAFKLVDETFGQLTYTRIYQGTLRRGDQCVNTRARKRRRIGRISCARQ